MQDMISAICAMWKELAKYVDVKKSHGKLLAVSREDIELYHRLFVARFGK